MNTLYTAGYSAGWTPESLQAEAERLGAYIFDIRANPTSTRPEWRKRELIRALGGLYLHVPQLGNLNYANNGPIKLAQPAAGVGLAFSVLKQRPLILLCTCANWQTCHRLTAAELCAEQLGCAVEHLEPPVDLTDNAIPTLTLTQPYARLVELGEKSIETRNWSTRYRGKLAIHAGTGLGPVGGKNGLYNLVASQPFYTALWRDGMPVEVDAIINSLSLGAIVATCELIDCVMTINPGVSNAIGTPWIQIQRNGRVWEVPPPEPEYSFGDYRPGRFAWILDDIRPLATPIPTRGYQRLWRWVPPSEVEYGN